MGQDQQEIVGNRDSSLATRAGRRGPAELASWPPQERHRRCLVLCACAPTLPLGGVAKTTRFGKKVTRVVASGRVVFCPAPGARTN